MNDNECPWVQFDEAGNRKYCKFPEFELFTKKFHENFCKYCILGSIASNLNYFEQMAYQWAVREHPEYNYLKN